MDAFTQRMLEKVEQRSRALGISNASNVPFAECVGDANTHSNGGASASGPAVAAAAAAAQLMKHQHQQHKQLPHQQQQLQHEHQEHAAMRSTASNTGTSNKLHVVEKKSDGSAYSSGSPNKVLRQFSAVDKENVNLGIEINIVTGKNVEVEVQVEEQDITDDEDARPPIQPRSREETSHPLANIRDTSRNRLQRLGALYSNTSDLSSPIHRTEGHFHAGGGDEIALDASPKRPKQRYGKLVALANTINEWEDDTAHHYPSHQQHQDEGHVVPPPKPDLPSRRIGGEKAKKSQAPLPPSTAHLSQPVDNKDDTCEKGAKGDSNKTKHLKWDPNVINSLEAQGFQRRESSTVKLAYEYSNECDHVQEEAPERVHIQSVLPVQQDAANEKSKVGKLASTFTVGTAKSTSHEKKTGAAAPDKLNPTVKKGLVSGRAAVFENKANTCGQPVQRPTKDPTELSLKERMQLFEKNKGEAILPKAAFGMAPSIAKIRQENHAKKDEANKAGPSSSTTTPASNPTKVIMGEGSTKVRDKVAALVASVTMSENKIKADIHKQRQEDMLLLANRFNRQKEVFAKSEQQEEQQPQAQEHRNVEVAPAVSRVQCPTLPPPPPPMPSTKTPPAAGTAVSSKRRSPGDAIDEEHKRARKASTATQQRIYPALSDLESNESLSDNDNCCTTATASGRSDATDDEERRTHATQYAVGRKSDARTTEGQQRDDDIENESYMESEANEDSSVGICNGSLGREIMQVVQKNEHEQQQHHHQHHQQYLHQTRKVKEVRYADKDYYYEDVSKADSSLNSSEASMGVDDYLDEALDDNVADGDDDFTQGSDEDEDDVNASRTSGGCKGTTTSNSFSYRKSTRSYANYQTISEENDDYQAQTPVQSSNRTDSESAGATTSTMSFSQPIKSELSVNQEDENMVTLVHTVSFYRRQQSANSASSTPVRKICREQQVLRSAVDGAGGTLLHFDSPDPEREEETYSDEGEHAQSEAVDADTDAEADESHLVQAKLKKLLDEVCKQQQVIAQTSQALNLCAATIEFSGSTESVEGERHLLVATHRRQSCLDEVQRLRVEKSLCPLGAPKERGRLTVKEITLPLRQDYIRKLASDTISGHHMVCLLKYNEHVLATKTVPTLPGLLAIKFPDVLQLNCAYADFKITLEIYGMTARREVLPHDVKYHIRTPKKKGSDNRLVMPPVQSPAGPNVVRTPGLVQYGFAIFSLREIQRTTWTLTQVLGISPLEGVVHMKVNCELSVSVEHKGFLTMFEDISGFGAWHRRWCYLNGTMLSYWKYPDDEKKKTPMGSIDLYTCSSQRVTTTPRDICARLNTMLLECQRPARDTDQESLVIVPNGRTTIVRHLLSADTKEEREEWCAYFNKALTLLRAWGPPQ